MNNETNEIKRRGYLVDGEEEGDKRSGVRSERLFVVALWCFRTRCKTVFYVRAIGRGLNSKKILKTTCGPGTRTGREYTELFGTGTVPVPAALLCIPVPGYL